MWFPTLVQDFGLFLRITLVSGSKDGILHLKVDILHLYVEYIIKNDSQEG